MIARTIIIAIAFCYSLKAVAADDYAWVFDGGIAPPADIDQLLTNTEPFSKEFLIGLIEVHLKNAFEAQIESRSAYLPQKRWSLPSSEKRILNKIQHIEGKGPNYLETHMATRWAIYNLSDWDPNAIKAEFFSNGINRYFLDDSDLHWTTLTDEALLKQESNR